MAQLLHGSICLDWCHKLGELHLWRGLAAEPLAADRDVVPDFTSGVCGFLIPFVALVLASLSKVLAAVRQCGQALRHAAEHLRDDKEHLAGRWF